MAATDPISLGIAGAAAVTALLAAWFQRRRAPELDGERWLKTTLATLLRGRVEADGGDAHAWARAVRTHVPYHPAGRRPDRKVMHPHAVVDGPLLEGEQALLEAMRQAPDVASRWAVLYDGEDELADALLADPVELGRAYDPSMLVAGAAWDDVAAWATGGDFGERLAARQPLRWVCFVPDEHGAESHVLAALRRVWPHVTWLAPETDPVECIQPLLEPGVRMVVAGEGDAAVRALQVMKDSPGLRDQVVAFVAIGAPLLGRPGGSDELDPTQREDWMGRWYGQEHLDTEDVRLTPYMALQWLDRGAHEPGTERQPLPWARFPPPQTQNAVVSTIESVDLGVLPRPGGPDDELIAKALLFVVAGWALQRG